MTRHAPTFIVSLFAAALSLGAARAALAQPAGLRAAAAIVPQDVGLLLAIEGATEWRKGPAGPALTALMTGVIRTQGGAAAWGKFAQDLGLNEDAAFDRLLGTRVVFAKRGGDEPPSWVLVSTIDRETERLLRQRLQPAPRRVEQGLPIMAIEDGRFWIASSIEGDGARIVLGPAEAPALFDEVSRAVANPPRVRVDPPGPAGQLLGRDRGASALFVARLPAEEQGWIGATITPDGRTFNIQFMVESAVLHNPEQNRAPWSRAAFDALDEHAFWRSLECPGASGGDVLSALGVGDAFDWARGFGEVDKLDGRCALVVSPAKDAIATVVVAWESSDVEAIARAGDKAVGKAIEPLFNGVPDAPPVDFDGAFPAAQRSVDLADTGAGQMLRPFFDEGPVLSWSFARQQAKDAHLVRGWWTLGLGKRAVASVSEGLAGAHTEAGPVAPWVSLGSARPSAFVQELRRRKLPLPESVRPLFDAAGLIERVEWETLRVGERTIVGKGVLILEPAPAAP